MFFSAKENSVGHLICSWNNGYCTLCCALYVNGLFQLGELGKGAGKGGGGGGSVREAGGAFGKRQAAEEERYFR